MPKPTRPGHISFDLSFKKAPASAPVDEEAPLRIAILGNFSGRSGGASGGISSCRPFVVDCDNFDSVCAQFGTSLHLPPCAGSTLGIDVSFKKLDDFHPDQLLKHVAPLAGLVQLRARLLVPATAGVAAQELREIVGGHTAAPASQPATSASTESNEDTLARLLGRPASEPPKPAPSASIVDQLIKQAIAPAVVPVPDAEHAQLLTMLDAELSARLREVLHHGDFQALEAAWRGLDFLVREAGDDVKLHVIDVSRDELDRQLASPDAPTSTPIGRQLDEIAPAVILGVYSFGAKDAGALSRIARQAGACGTAFVAGAKPELAGCISFASQPNPHDWTRTFGSELEAFAEVRRAAESAHIGLALPRFLLRQPYGRESDPIDSFPFEELPVGDTHECYLWGNAALLCGHVLINAFASDGWDMDLGGAGGEVSGLPVHSFNVGGERQAKPCAEAWLSENAAEAILARGLMPVLSVRGRDAVLLASLRSISDPARPLAFRAG